MIWKSIVLAGFIGITASLVHKVQAQDSSYVDFFPFKAGDFWVYSDYSQVKQSVVNEVKYRVYADSSDSAGTLWAYVEIDDHSPPLDSLYYRKDSSGDVYINFGFGELRALKQNAITISDRWLGGKIDEERYAVYSLKDIYSYTSGGEEIRERDISYSVTTDTAGFPNGGELYGYVWREGFGIRVRYTYDGGNRLSMKGSFKNGEVYGDTTFNEITIDTVRTNFFPYKKGDVWVYEVSKASTVEKIHEVRYFAYKDSLAEDGSYWLFIEKNENGEKKEVYYREEDNGDIYSNDFIGVDALKFRNKAVKVDTFWVGSKLGDENYTVFRLLARGTSNPFNNSRNVYESRNIELYITQDSTANYTCCGKAQSQEVWIANFGLQLYFDAYMPERDYVWLLKGIFKEDLVFGDTTFTIVTGIEDLSEVPKEFQVYQNYPNPFNPSTTIEYQVSNPVNLSVSLFTYTGQKIAEIYQNKVHSPGNYALKIDESILGDISSSLLIVLFETQGNRQVKRITYIK